MKIALVCGSWPPERCGVGDYSAKLQHALQDAGVDVERIELRGWSFRRSAHYRELLKYSGADVIHVQYPSVGYGRSLVPALTPFLGLNAPLVVTLHEYEIYRSYRRPWFWSFAYRARARLFSREAERAAFAKSFPRRSGDDHVVPIGSNIPVGHAQMRQEGSVAFFGLFWPGKGIEDMFDLARQIKAVGGDPGRLSIVGAPVAGQGQFAEFIRRQCGDLGVRLFEDRPADEVADILSGHAFAYLPFPGGADERRGSLAAAIVNGCLPITRHGQATPDWLKNATISTETPEDAIAILVNSENRPDQMDSLRKNVQAAAERYAWPCIAKRHRSIYDAILANRTR